ncbi:MAG TPA: cytochrome c [Thermoanaerobaculia bacterium]|nr:cytochrome c [Thermoanaerobaculia bacterium]
MRPRSALLLLAALPLLAGCAKKPETPPEIYAAYCARCHGDEGEGKGDARSLKLYPHLDLLASPMVRRGDRALVRDRIAKGDGPMPGFSRRLSPQEIESLVDFTLALPKKKAGD